MRNIDKRDPKIERKNADCGERIFSNGRGCKNIECRQEGNYEAAGKGNEAHTNKNATPAQTVTPIATDRVEHGVGRTAREKDRPDYRAVEQQRVGRKLLVELRDNKLHKTAKQHRQRKHKGGRSFHVAGLFSRSARQQKNTGLR